MGDRRELLNDSQEALRLAMDGRISSLWTNIPGLITKVDFAKMTCEVQPAIQGEVRDSKGVYSFVNLPLLVDVPIVFPSAGGFSLTLPMKAGDEVLVLFSSRCIDSWWSNGGVGIPMEYRMHDLSDGFAIPGPKSLPKAISAISSTNVQLRSDDGATYLEITPAGVVKVKATTAEIEAATINLTGDVVIPVGKTLTIAGINFALHKHSTSTNPSGVPV